MAVETRSKWLAVSYALTIFISAFLLFQVQPIVSKYILPWFGGSPAVWTTCMLFFQSLLFAGYAYAHFSSQRLGPKQQALLHLAIILTALVLLHVVPDESWKPTDSATEPIGRILLLLAASVGLPYFVLSTTGPLVQSWFARSFPGRTPYRLYALSNLGSLLALLSYPIFFERIFDVPHQAVYWSWGFFAFAALCAIAAMSLWGDRSKPHFSRVASDALPAADGLLAADDAQPSTDTASPHWWQFALWVILPALASITLLATTNHICTDVAVMPFLWVVPLSLYLLTFIVAFDHPRWYRPAIIAAVTLFSIYWVGVGKGETDLFDLGVVGNVLHWASDTVASWRGMPAEHLPESPSFTIGLLPYLVINFLAMFGICMLCHGELVRQRPHPKYLTAFYLLISAGGASGAVAVTLLAPRLFKTFYEWELSTFFGYLLCVGILLWAFSAWVRKLPRSRWAIPSLALFAIIAVIGWIDLTNNLYYDEHGVLLRTRNFFGTLVVRQYDVNKPDGRVILKHGATTHGLQYLDPKRHDETTTYYTPFSGIGRTLNYLHGEPQAPALADDDEAHIAASRAAIAKVRATEDQNQSSAEKQSNPQPANQSKLRIGAVGLGAGTLANYVRPGESITFYEINPDVIEIADSGNWFTNLPDCRARGGKCDVKLGDARLTLDGELHDPDHKKFDLLVLDAFSGDAIPAHLLTEEAFKIYLPLLANAAADGHDGVIAIHITNHYVDLEPVVRGLAEKSGLQAVRIHNPIIEGQGVFRSDWMILTRDEKLLATLQPFASDPSKSQDGGPAKPTIVWTDGFSNLFDVLK